MFRFVAFLRGINVGGRTVKKETLQKVFASLGFANVTTYKQSGNVIFDAESTNLPELKAKIEAELQSVLGYGVPVFLRTLPELKALIDADPFKNQTGEGASFLVTFLASAPQSFPSPLPFIIPKSKAQIISAKGTEVFSVTYGGGEGALPNPFLEKTLKTKATTRNINVVREITEKNQ